MRPSSLQAVWRQSRILPDWVRSVRTTGRRGADEQEDSLAYVFGQISPGGDKRREPRVARGE
jgi:hypothetical protein